MAEWCTTCRPLAAPGRRAATAEQAREMKIFGPEVPCSAEAPPLDRLVALTGRDPGWRS
ncbi:hypothetical protein [Amycolatopsis deserti]|nr:hypothetical protein [Amycolatopsis deserti]